MNIETSLTVYDELFRISSMEFIRGDPTGYLQRLPGDVILRIMEWIPIWDLLNLRATCHTCHDVFDLAIATRQGVHAYIHEADTIVSYTCIRSITVLEIHSDDIRNNYRDSLVSLLKTPQCDDDDEYYREYYDYDGN